MLLLMILNTDLVIPNKDLVIPNMDLAIPNKAKIRFASLVRWF